MNAGRQPTLRTTTLPTLVLTFVTATGPVLASVHVVDAANGPGTDFISLPQAIAASAPFDTLLLRSGSYADIHLDGKSLNFIADVGANVTIGGTTPDTSSVSNLPGNGLITFRGIRFTNASIYAGAGSFVTETALRLENNSGQLWFEECTDLTTNPTLEISNCQRVLLTRCAFAPQVSHAAALVIDHSTVAITECSIQGSLGQDGGPASFGVGVKPAQPGGDAIVAGPGTSLVISRSSIVGGDGGDGYLGTYCSDPNSGGNGIRLMTGSPAPVVRSVASSVLGGSAGHPPGCGGTAVAGESVVGSGLVVEFTGTPVTLSASNPVREGQSGSITVTNGSVGASVLLLIGNYPATQFVPAFAGTLAVGSPFSIFGFGILTGPTLSFSYTAPQLPAFLDEYHVFAQIGSCTPQGDCVLGNPSQIILLDSSL